MIFRKTLFILGALSVCACSMVNPQYDAAKAHHRPNGFVNSDPSFKIGTLPWYDILWRRLRGDFQPMHPPEGGYDKFIADWSQPVDHALLATPGAEPRLTWLGHASILLQLDGQNILIDGGAYPGTF